MVESEIAERIAARRAELDELEEQLVKQERILAAVRQAGAPVATRAVGETLGLDIGVRGKLEPLRGTLTRLAERGWLRKQPDGRYAVRLR